MPAPALSITPVQARRFVLQRLGLVRPYATVAGVLADLGYVQLDPINVCGRMHDLILRNRVAGYREGELLRHTHALDGREREAFEHYLPGRGILVVFPLSVWPVIATVTHARREGRSPDWTSRRLTRVEKAIARRILEEIRERGPLTSDDIEHDGRTMTAWGTPGRLVKTVLEALFYRGEVLIRARRDFRRVYDLPERVIPEAVRAKAPLDHETVRRELVRLQVRQRRLVALKRRDRALLGDEVVDVRVDGGPVAQVLREDLAHLEASADAAAESGDVQLLAPLDPAIYDRAVTRRVWDFDYTWEVYTPPVKRVRGYYALPVLSRGEIVGHVDSRVDREARRLRVVSRSVRRGHVTRDAVRALAAFLGVRALG